MAKDEYLDQVSPFVEWMSRNLDTTTLRHRYRNRRDNTHWQCNSLYHAYQSYAWRYPAIPEIELETGHTFASNAEALQALQGNLVDSLGPDGSDAKALEATIEVMRWGGVSAGNVKWLNNNKVGLSGMLRDIREALNAGDTQDNRLRSESLRFNAGMTKVYSLICDDFIIYDSRVAAALGWAVVQFCNASGKATIPAALKFPWAPAHEGPNAQAPKQRNPSQGELLFPLLRSGSMHAEWNLKASWLLRAVLDHPNVAQSGFTQNPIPGDNALRALEAALFMIGYDLPSAPPAGETPRPIAVNPLQADEWVECRTGAQNIPFQYQVTQNGIEIRDGVNFATDAISETLSTLWSQLNEQAFPLANSATGVRDGTVPMGMGTAYYQATGLNPPDSSRLAAILEDLRVITRADVPANGMHWRLNRQLLQLNEPDASLDINPVLQDILDAGDEL